MKRSVFLLLASVLALFLPVSASGGPPTWQIVVDVHYTLISGTPEPGGIILLLSGLGLLGIMALRRK
jgi:ABC-type arginine/histidine transport system permease subunit